AFGAAGDCQFSDTAPAAAQMIAPNATMMQNTVQMAAIHKTTIVAATRLARVETIPQQDSASNMLNKLARTFTAQVEALKKYRSAGEQTIKVQHVTVSERLEGVSVSRGERRSAQG